ncbi:hypothetical protein TWF694_009592 [Orbilia ellipsospora]|uniref:Uncharacterized protein n=1 Tax=Orbilia ellipsospora TaxID=2528407 RepID=A0AAV9XEB9_9PEZI
MESKYLPPELAYYQGGRRYEYYGQTPLICRGGPKDPLTRETIDIYEQTTSRKTRTPNRSGQKQRSGRKYYTHRSAAGLRAGQPRGRNYSVVRTGSPPDIRQQKNRKHDSSQTLRSRPPGRGDQENYPSRRCRITNTDAARPFQVYRDPPENGDVQSRPRLRPSYPEREDYESRRYGIADFESILPPILPSESEAQPRDVFTERRKLLSAQLEAMVPPNRSSRQPAEVPSRDTFTERRKALVTQYPDGIPSNQNLHPFSSTKARELDFGRRAERAGKPTEGSTNPASKFEGLVDRSQRIVENVDDLANRLKNLLTEPERPIDEFERAADRLGSWADTSGNLTNNPEVPETKLDRPKYDFETPTAKPIRPAGKYEKGGGNSERGPRVVEPGTQQELASGPPKNTYRTVWPREGRSEMARSLDYPSARKPQAAASYQMPEPAPQQNESQWRRDSVVTPDPFLAIAVKEINETPVKPKLSHTAVARSQTLLCKTREFPSGGQHNQRKPAKREGYTPRSYENVETPEQKSHEKERRPKEVRTCLPSPQKPSRKNVGREELEVRRYGMVDELRLYERPPHDRGVTMADHFNAEIEKADEAEFFGLGAHNERDMLRENEGISNDYYNAYNVNYILNPTRIPNYVEAIERQSMYGEIEISTPTSRDRIITRTEHELERGGRGQVNGQRVERDSTRRYGTIQDFYGL